MTTASRRRGRTRRTARGLAALSGLGVAANGLRLRARLTHLPRVEAPTGADPDLAAWRLVTVTGGEVSPAAFAATVAWAEANGLDAVDVIPEDLPVHRALDVAREVDPRTYRTDPLCEGRSARHALVVREEVAKRAGLPDGPVPASELVEVGRQVKRFAPRTHDLAVVPGVSAAPLDHAGRRAAIDVQWDRYRFLAFGIPGVQLGTLGATAVAAPAWGLPALAAFAAQPLVALTGLRSGLRPRDLTRQLPLRPVDDARRLVGVVGAASTPPPLLREAEAKRPAYEAELAGGVERFLEPRVDACPWCGSADLTTKVVSPDLIQHKPGEFRLDQCGACRHIFQNPRLSIEGLDFYYRDFYDGLGAGEMDRIFAAGNEQYEGRIGMVADSGATPRRWLDVGTGHGHFCLVAQERWPDVDFEGVDQSSSIEEAVDRGWVAAGHRGLFPELAPGLAGRYDVVSMHHYLEHTREPKEELDAAATVLRPGGLLMIEVPDPECGWGTALGNKWLPWFQPQHQHFVPIANLEAALEERGFTVVDRHRTRANQALDLVAGMWLGLGQVVPRQGMPWQPPTTRAKRFARGAVVAAAVPAMVATGVADKVIGAVPRPGGHGNTYRVLARLDP